MRLHRGIHSRMRNVFFKLLGVRLNGYVWMQRVSIPRQWSDITLGRGVSLDDGVVLLCSGPPKNNKLVIGTSTYINRYAILDAHEQILVGSNCMIGPLSYITDANHGMTLGVKVRELPMEIKPVVIEDEVWIGAGVIILSGVRVGRGAVIGAGAVVTKDIPAHTIVVGVPAKEIGRRTRG
jgi:acetyltransferase-like isoleucine patch superfamily enzyme